MRISLDDLQRRLPRPATERWPGGVWDVEGLRHGSMSAVLFTPRERDYQSAHDQDELYVIVAGSGTLRVDGAAMVFSRGDVLFVPARSQHRFDSFTDDLVTWAIFWGPVGGESEPVRSPHENVGPLEGAGSWSGRR